MPSLVLDIALPAHRLIAVYQGRASRVVATSRDGRRVSLPVHHLRPHLTEDGIYGSFRLEFAEDGRLISLNRLA